jgi:hypothetical protein
LHAGEDWTSVVKVQDAPATGTTMAARHAAKVRAPFTRLGVLARSNPAVATTASPLGAGVGLGSAAQGLRVPGEFEVRLHSVEAMDWK